MNFIYYYLFVGPERYSDDFGDREEVLYIGTTFTAHGNYRHSVPALATRNLVDLDFSKFTFSEQSLLRIDVKYRDHFLVKYVYGFNASSYVYFLTVQKKSHLPGQEEAGFISRISRVCISDDNYDSYTEITLECHDKRGNLYNLVQDAAIFRAGAHLAASMGINEGDEVMLAAFSKAQGHSNNPQKSTAMCMYSIKEIDVRFNENIHMCFNGSRKHRSMEYISGTILDGKCPSKWSTGNIHNFCDVGLKISGSAPLDGRASLLLNDSLITSVLATPVGVVHSVAFLGTSEGTLKKVSFFLNLLKGECFSEIKDFCKPTRIFYKYVNIGYFINNDMQIPPRIPPSPFKSFHIEFLAPKDAQCSETYAKAIFRFFSRSTKFSFSFSGTRE